MEDHGVGPAVGAPGGQGGQDGKGGDVEGERGVLDVSEVGALVAGDHQRKPGSREEQGAPEVEGHHVGVEDRQDLKKQKHLN